MTREPRPSLRIRERAAMIAGMTPRLDPASYVFCTKADAAQVDTLIADSLCLFREHEGITLILPIEVAGRAGFDVATPMVRIVLEVFSDLEGVGLTAAVAGALADQGIACNVVAAFHHDHVFVPAERGARAVAILNELQRRAQAGEAV